MHQLTISVCFLFIINLVFTHIQQQRFKEARFISKYVLSCNICVGHCLQIAECSAVRFTRSCRHCQLFSDVLWLHRSEIPPPVYNAVEYKK